MMNFGKGISNSKAAGYDKGNRLYLINILAARRMWVSGDVID